MYRIIVIVFLFILAIGFIVSWYSRQNYGTEKVTTASSETRPLAEKNDKPVVRHPIPGHPQQKNVKEISEATQTAGQTSPEPLPALDDSDDAILTLLDHLFGQQQIRNLLNVDNIIRRFVVTVDSITRSKLPIKYLSTKPVAGQFKTTTQKAQEDAIFIHPDNYKRYTPYVDFVDALDIDKIVEIYIHFYPLFQQAYEDLGFQSAYFNDRLIEALDHLLETPEIQGPVEVIQPSVMYKFSDPDVETLSTGQKTLLRLGDDNARRIKAKLLTLRNALSDNKLE